MTKPRKRVLRDALNRDDYWMGMALFYAAGSRTAGRQQGAVIVGANFEPLGWGMDGPPKCMPDCEHVLHAEMNALFNAKIPAAGGSIYITHSPCYDCTLAILAANIKRIIYLANRPLDSAALDAVRNAYAQIDEFRGNLYWMRDHLMTLDTLGIFT